MTAQEVIFEIQSLSQEERAKLQAWLRSQEDALDVALLKERATRLCAATFEPFILIWKFSR